MIGLDDRLSIREQCGLLSLSRSGYYFVPQQETELNLRLLRRIDEIHVAGPTWGSRMLVTVTSSLSECSRATRIPNLR